MKNNIFLAFILFAILGCSRQDPLTDTLLVCEGESKSLVKVPSIFGSRSDDKERQRFTISKRGDKVIKVKTDNHVFTLDKVDVSTSKNKGPIYLKLIVESDKLILRTEVTEDNNVLETVLYNTGAFEVERLFGWVKGQCTVSKKAF